MKFRKFKQNKLWRDNAIELMENTGSKIHWIKLNDDEFLKELRLKFIEEANEVFNSKTKENLIEELADILEIINSFCDIYKFTIQDIKNAQIKKHKIRGGFEGRKFVTIAEHKIDSFGEKYCLADPEKYPEIIE